RHCFCSCFVLWRHEAHRAKDGARVMIIASRVLKVVAGDEETEVPVRFFAPGPGWNGIDWLCRVEIDWPERTRTAEIHGVDAVQALELALKFAGVEVYASGYHEARTLVWLEPGEGYGFPVPNGIRDLLIGDDKRL